MKKCIGLIHSLLMIGALVLGVSLNLHAAYIRQKEVLTKQQAIAGDTGQEQSTVWEPATMGVAQAVESHTAHQTSYIPKTRVGTAIPQGAKTGITADMGKTTSMPAASTAASTAEQTPAPVNLPASFTPEGGATKSISVGCRNGNVEAWCLSPDSTSLMRYNASETNAASAWVNLPAHEHDAKKVDKKGKIISPLKCVSVSSDGIMMILDAQGKVYLYNWDLDNFMVLPERDQQQPNKTTGKFEKTGKTVTFDRISVGGGRNIWAVDRSNNVVYQLHTSYYIWYPRHVGIDVAAGVDGVVMIIDETNTPQLYTGNNAWAPQNIKLDHIAIANRNHIYGSYQGGLWQFTNNAWTHLAGADGKPSSGVAEVAVNAADTLFVTDQSGNIYNNGEGAILIETALMPSKKLGGKREKTKIMKNAEPKKVSRYAAKVSKSSALRQRIAAAKSMSSPIKTKPVMEKR